MSNIQAMLSSKDMTWETPQDLFDELNKEFNFTLDPCATPKTAKCEKYYTKEDDGLSRGWRDEIVFCNPPYGREISQWVKKAYDEVCVYSQLYKDWNTQVVMLIPARTDTKYFHDYIYNKPNVEIRFIKGRLKFRMGGVEAQSAPFPSMLVIFKNNNK